jgi:transcriptional regulator GlxA family with amidase domain
MSPSVELVKSSCGLSVAPDSGLIDPSGLDYIVVVGGLLKREAPLSKEATQYLEHAAAAGSRLVGICTGSFILCRLGLLRNRKCCISWYHYHDFLDEFPDLLPVADQLFVIDGNRITCAGGASVAFLAAHLVEQHVSPASAQKALRILQFDRKRAGTSSQPAPPLNVTRDSDKVSRALLMMEQNLTTPIPVKEIARRVYMSTRQLERLFRKKIERTPHDAYLHLRLAHGRWLLGSDLSIAEIAVETGFADGPHFTKTFKAAFGQNPSDDRRARRSLIAETLA